MTSGETENKYHIQTIIPMYNNEEKLDEINRLLDILSKRKRYSILVSMLLVFQKYNFQKLLKEFLVEGVQQLILNNPFKVVSFNGVPFTIKNCFMGMRVIIGKHRIFQREMIQGYEFLNVNLVYTCIFLTDEIAKICAGSRNQKPVHSSLLDELDIEESNMLREGLNSIANMKKNAELKLNQKRERTESNNFQTGSVSSENMSSVNKKNDNIINLGDSDESDDKEYGVNNKVSHHKKGRKKNINVVNASNGNNNSEKNKKNENSIFANIFYPKDNNYFRCPIQEFLSVWNFERASPVNVYLKDNLQNITKIKNIFILMQNIGAQGESFLKNLMKYVPELNEASPQNNTEKDEKQNEEKKSETFEESKKVLQKIDEINNIFKEYENKKKKLINIYQRIKTTTENMKSSQQNQEKMCVKEDLNYLNMINNRFNEITKEIFPLFNQMCEYNKNCELKEISNNLQNVSRTLKENDLTLKTFSIFMQGLMALFPPGSSNITTLSDLLLNENLNVEERERKFIEIVTKKKDALLLSINELNLDD